MKPVDQKTEKPPMPASAKAAQPSPGTRTIDAAMFSVARVSTFSGTTLLTAASGFFFERAGRLFFVTSRHVLVDAATGHHPDRVEIVIHTDPVDLTKHASMALPLYLDRTSLWRQGQDSGGEIDVAAIELDRGKLPPSAVFCPFTPDHFQASLEDVPLGTPLLVLGFPLGFYDTLHNLPVARHATVASAFGVRFQGQGYFLTDARMHRGASGAPVLMKGPDGGNGLRWKLLGIHSARMDMRTRELGVDETLGLNCAWYADILLALTG